MELCTSELPPSLLRTLMQKGFRTRSDLLALSSIRQLAQETGMKMKEANIVMTWAHKPLLLTTINPTLHDINHSIPLPLTQMQLALNGLPLGEMTEFVGAPGSGKTQWGMHLALSVQCIDGEAVYIDTEGSLMKSRVIEMASCRLEKSVQEWCSHIHYYRVHDYQELHEVVKQLPLVLKEFPKIRLVIIDSIAFHFRHEFDDMTVRTKCLQALAGELREMTSQFSIAMVLMNHVTTRASTMIPALGETWSHALTHRFQLTKNEQGFRTVSILKSPLAATQDFPYQITRYGIQSPQETTTNEQRHKRPLSP